jgi:hypothetical protein
LIERSHPAPGLAATPVRVAGMPSSPRILKPLARKPLIQMALPLVLMAALAGCRHKTTPLVLPQVSLAPVDLEVPPESENPPMIEPEPETSMEIPPLPPPAPPRRPAPRKPAPPPQTQPPVQVAGTTDPAALAIGALSSGGDSGPQTLQQTRDLIAAIKKRVSALSSKIASQQKAEISQVNRFLKQAQQALDTGDAEGAKNLATKAKLLMDDVEKK